MRIDPLPVAPWRERARSISLSLAVLLLLHGCARAPKNLPPPVPLPSSDVDALLSRLRSREEGIRRAVGIVGARGRGPEGSFDARLVILFERPDRLRVELMGAFGGTRWSAVATGEGIVAYFPGRKQYLKEGDVGDVVTRLLGLRLEPTEVMAILAGVGIPLDSVTGARGERRGASTFVSMGEDSGRRLEISAEGQVVRAVTPSYRVSYPTSWKSRGRQIPDEVVLENEEIRTTLRTDEVDVNVDLDPDAFALDIPGDAVRLRPAELEGEAVFVVPPERKRRDRNDRSMELR
jgi:hypothetical protein